MANHWVSLVEIYRRGCSLGSVLRQHQCIPMITHLPGTVKTLYGKKEVNKDFTGVAS
jgi:hypothetical protein